MAIEASRVAQGISVALTIGVSQAVPIAVPQAVPIVAIEGVSIGIGNRLGFSNGSGVSLCLSFSLGGKMLEESIFYQTISLYKQPHLKYIVLKSRRPCGSSKFCVGCSIVGHSGHSWAYTCNIKIKEFSL